MPRRAVAEVSKTGWTYILDRQTGEPLLGIDEQPVPQEPRQFTSPTQPIPRGAPIGPRTLDIPVEGYELANDGQIFNAFWTEPVIARRLGANWPPSAYDPRTQTLFICANDRTFFYSVDERTSVTPPGGARYMGGAFGPADVPPPTGLLAAMDMATNTPVWRQRLAERCYSGVTATAGGLIFVGRNDGRLTALDSRDGDMLWEFQTGAGVNAPASVFEHNGEQYVTVLSAGNLFAGTPRGDSLWLFGLNGTLNEAAPAARGALTSLAIPADPAASDIDGAQLYAQACQFCHGDEGQGAENGISLRASSLRDITAIGSVVRDGRNQMPAFGGMLSNEQIRAVAEHVSALTKR
jgi:quinohemoprotein ethanol dehydrogenase